LGLVAVALSLFSEAVAAVAFDAVWPLLLALRGIVALAAAVPGAVVHLPAPPPLAVASYVGGLALLVFQKRLAAAILLAVAGGATCVRRRGGDGAPAAGNGRTAQRRRPRVASRGRAGVVPARVGHRGGPRARAGGCRSSPGDDGTQGGSPRLALVEHRRVRP